MRRIFCFHKSNSGEIARNRLKLLLVSDQAHINPGIIELIREDMIGVLSRYAEVDSRQLDLSLTQMETAGAEGAVTALSARIPIRHLNNMRNE